MLDDVIDEFAEVAAENRQRALPTPSPTWTARGPRDDGAYDGITRRARPWADFSERQSNSPGALSSHSIETF